MMFCDFLCPKEWFIEKAKPGRSGDAKPPVHIEVERGVVEVTLFVFGVKPTFSNERWAFW